MLTQKTRVSRVSTSPLSLSLRKKGCMYFCLHIHPLCFHSLFFLIFFELFFPYSNQSPQRFTFFQTIFNIISIISGGNFSVIVFTVFIIIIDFMFLTSLSFIISSKISNICIIISSCFSST